MRKAQLFFCLNDAEDCREEGALTFIMAIPSVNNIYCDNLIYLDLVGFVTL